jgi:iron complex outermembrane receptor protein
MLFNFSTAFAQQKVKFIGKITNESGQKLIGANVSLKKTRYGATTNEQGVFEIRNISSGNYKLLVSYLGYYNYEKPIEIKNGMKELVVVLKAKTEQISEALVLSKRLHKTEEALKINAPLKDLPLTSSTVSSELIEQRQISSLNEAVRYSTGIAPSLNYGGFQTFRMRGFGKPIIMLDGSRDERMNFSSSAPVTSLAAVEQVEYLKGPAAILYGHSAIGGILNIVRKKPTKEFKANVDASYGSWESKEIKFGAGGAINEKLNYRFDFGMSEREGWRDNGDKTSNAYLALDYNLNDKNQISLKFGANKDFYGTETGIPTVTNDLYNVDTDKIEYRKGDFPKGYDREQRYNDVDDYLNHRNYNLQADYVHKFTDVSKLNFSASFSHDVIDYFSTESLSFLESENPIYDNYYLDGEDKVYICVDSLQRTYPLRFAHYTDSYQQYLDYSTEFETGNINHKFLGGYYLMYVDRTSNSGYSLGKDVTGDGLYATIAFENPVLNQGNLSTKFSKASNYYELLNSFYVQDLIEFNSKLKAMIGLRADIYNTKYQSAKISEGREQTDKSKVNNQDQFSFTYRVGLVYQPTDEISLYGSISSFFKPNRKSYNPTYIYIDEDGKEFKPKENEPYFDPEKGYQMEMGLKYNVNSKLQLNGSVFYINKENIVEYLGKKKIEINEELKETRVYGQVGVVSSKGFDIELLAKPINGLEITAGYERTIAKYEDFSVNDFGENSNEGNYLPMVPKDRFVSWIYYCLQDGFAKGLNFGLGYENVAKKYTSSSNSLYLDSYDLLDASVGYKLDNMYFKLGVNNICDKEYFTNTISNQLFPGYGRNYKFTVGLKF